MKSKIYHSITLVLIVFLNLAMVHSQETVKDGSLIAPFKATADNGEVWDSQDYIGKENLVVFFYPAAMTGGCTKQACSYRDDKAELDKLNARIIGISGDDVSNLDIFKMAYNLNFTLLSDPEGKIANIFGVPVREGEKSITREIDGKEVILKRSVTTARWTFVIDKEGKVIYRSTEVDAANDSKQVIKALSGK